MMLHYPNPSMGTTCMTIWRPSLRRPERPASPSREADLEMALALVLMGVVILLTTLVVPALGR